jgi:hypothetical protein
VARQQARGYMDAMSEESSELSRQEKTKDDILYYATWKEGTAESGDLHGWCMGRTSEEIDDGINVLVNEGQLLRVETPQGNYSVVTFEVAHVARNAPGVAKARAHLEEARVANKRFDEIVVHHLEGCPNGATKTHLVGLMGDVDNRDVSASLSRLLMVKTVGVSSHGGRPVYALI